MTYTDMPTGLSVSTEPPRPAAGHSADGLYAHIFDYVREHPGTWFVMWSDILQRANAWNVREGIYRGCYKGEFDARYVRLTKPGVRPSRFDIHIYYPGPAVPPA